ncbi:hypothetical protein Tco_1321047 [Tanacetum coccineum]
MSMPVQKSQVHKMAKFIRWRNEIMLGSRTTKLINGILMFPQHHGESLSEAWTRSKDLIQKFPHHGIDLWLQVYIFYNRIDHTLKGDIDYAAEGRLRKMSTEEAWNSIKELVQYEEEEWDDPIFSEKGSLNYENANMEQILENKECQVDSLMKDAISLVEKSENLCELMRNEAGYLSPEPLHQEAFDGLVMNFILDQEEKVQQLEECMRIVKDDFLQLSSEVIKKLKEEIRTKEQ